MRSLQSIDDLLIKNKWQEEILQKANELKERFAKRAGYNDEKARFPFENFEELKKEGFVQLTVPKNYGGDEITLYDFLLIQEKIAEGDGATSLSLGWHNGIVMNIRDSNKWDEEKFSRLCKEIVKKGKFINSCATEPTSGSPARGGKPKTTAKREGNSWIINGHKTFTSLAPILDYFIVTATIEETGEVGEFLVPKEASGIHIEETWNTIGMRATRSDDLILKNVKVAVDQMLTIRGDMGNKQPQGWLLHIPACYIGIAKAARDYAVQFAKSYQPQSLPHPISEVPEVRRKVAEIDIELMKSRHFMYHVASLWDQYPEKRREMGEELAAVKYVVTNSAVKIVDIAMRIVGGQSLMKSHPLERYYRDVRAGLHNPPADDLTFMKIGNKAFMS